MRLASDDLRSEIIVPLGAPTSASIRFAHELGRQPGVLVGVLDADRLAVDDGQLVAQLVADVAVVADLVHRPDEVAVVPVRLLADDPVVPLEAADRPVGPALEFAAEVREHLERADRLRRLRGWPSVLRSGMRGASRQTFRCGESDLVDHPQDVVVILDERLVILQGQRHPGVAGVAGALDQGLAAPAPDLLGREFLVDDRPVALGDVVGGQLRVARHAPPGQEDAQGRAHRSRPSCG